MIKTMVVGDLSASLTLGVQIATAYVRSQGNDELINEHQLIHRSSNTQHLERCLARRPAARQRQHLERCLARRPASPRQHLLAGSAGRPAPDGTLFHAYLQYMLRVAIGRLAPESARESYADIEHAAGIQRSNVDVDRGELRRD